MSLISTIGCNGLWVRYFVAETEPYFGRPSEDDDSPNWDNLQLLIDSFPGKISEREIKVPSAVLDYLAQLLKDPTAPPTEQALALTRDCPIDLLRLANYLTVSIDMDGYEIKDGYEIEARLTLSLHRATYTVAPSLLELAALNTQNLGFGLNAAQVDSILGKYQSRSIKRRTGVTLGELKYNQDQYQDQEM